MSAEKRPVSDDFGSSQVVVKRQNLGNDSKVVARANGSGTNGALVQAVCTVQNETIIFVKLG
jgi:Prp8 binding protein